MGRTRRFDRDEVIDEVIALFWREGYAGTSIGDIIDETKLSRSSLYHAFGSKDGLFAECVTRYSDAVDGPALQELSSSVLTQALYDFFDILIESYASPDTPAGCLGALSAIERGDVLDQGGEAIRKATLDLRAALQARLELAVTNKDLPDNADCETLSDLLIVLVRGLAVVNRTGTGPAQLRAVVKAGLRILDNPPVLTNS